VLGPAPYCVELDGNTGGCGTLPKGNEPCGSPDMLKVATTLQDCFICPRQGQPSSTICADVLRFLHNKFPTVPCQPASAMAADS
jgi:hypothetical protein